MPLAYPQRASIPRPALPDTLVLAAVALLLLAGAAGRVPALAVVALAGWSSCPPAPGPSPIRPGSAPGRSSTGR
ncbi:hypothetical protein AB0B83_25500, partial [Micromonospora sp. NPDC049060]|uniref:hypothetical protein n=1 Tax=Micromonospora sp. NPDC049060 TaxID=3154828 RepID=UPI0033DFA4D0